MQNALEANGLDLLLFNLGHRGDRFEAILARAKALRLSGLILATSDPVDMAAIGSFRSEMEFSACPIIVVGQDRSADGIPSVWHDDEQGAFEATDYLLRRGCRKIGYVGRIEGSAVGSWRYQGYRRALGEWGVEVAGERVFDCAYRYPAGYASGEKIAARQEDFDAVVCGSDEMALGVMAAAADAGIAVPGALSIIGFGDIEWASFVRPAMTTLSTNYRELATQAAQIVVSAESPAGPVLQHKIGRQLMIRGSTI